MSRAVLGLGANLGERMENLNHALEALALLPGTSISKVSNVYETVPVEVLEEQDDYFNLCVLLETKLSPRALLGACLGIEAGLGRVRVKYHGARVLDIDLLLYEGAVSGDEELTLPHPRMLERAFVLVPLADLFPEQKALGVDFSSKLAVFGRFGIRQIK